MELDTTKPHIGRIYDFMLGGHHNYEPDRQAAAAILKVFPAYPKLARLNRWFLQYVASEWAQEGHSRLLDLASGLPTEGHFNDYLPDARILFSDNDALSVVYGQELLKDRPNMSYCQADLGQPDALLEHAARFFGDERRLAIGCIGVAYFLPDQPLQCLMRRLHAFCAPGSVMGISFLTLVEGSDGAAVDAINAIMLRLARVQAHFRTAAQLAEIIAPWRLKEAQPVQRWLDVESILSEEELAATGAYLTGGMIER